MDNSSEFPKRKSLGHTRPAWLTEDAVMYHIVICAETRSINSFCHDAAAGKIIQSIQFYETKGLWVPYLIVLMPDHIHGIWSFPDNQSMSSVISRWKSYLNRNAGLHFQKNFFDHRLRTGEKTFATCEYIMNNPVRAGLVDDISKWPYIYRVEENINPFTH